MGTKPMTATDYIVISPVRNEANYLPLTINSMVSQSVRPRRWVLVDDGSSDETGRIVDEAAGRYGWIQAVHRPDRGYRQAGGGVIEAFYEGYHLAQHEPWQFLVKLDGDLTFGSDYFQRCLDEFGADRR